VFIVALWFGWHDRVAWIRVAIFVRVGGGLSLIDLAQRMLALLRVLDAGDGLDRFVAAAHHFDDGEIASFIYAYWC
jgi:hypothetical protein